MIKISFDKIKQWGKLFKIKNNLFFCFWAIIILGVLIFFLMNFLTNWHWGTILTVIVFLGLVSLWIINPSNLIVKFFGKVEKERTNAKILQYIGIICGSIILLANLDALTKANKLSADTNILTKKGQLDTRFKDAAILLGNENIPTSISGIYALQQIAEESSKDADQQHYPKIIKDIFITILSEEFALKIDENENLIFLKKPMIIAQRIIDCLKDTMVYTRTDYDFSYLNLTAIDFSGMKLNGANFSYAKLDSASFRGASLIGTNFQYAKLRGVSFGGKILWKNLTKGQYATSVEGADLTDASFGFAYLQGADFGNTRLINTNFAYADLQEAGFRYATLKNVGFGNANLERADFFEVDLFDSKIYGANFSKANLIKANFTNVEFSSIFFPEDSVIFTNTILEGYSYEDIKGNKNLTEIYKNNE